MLDPRDRRPGSPWWRDPREASEPPVGLPGDAPLGSEWSLWLYIAKGLALLVLGCFLLINLSYGFWELLALLE